jgi:uncharacterized protein
MSSVEHMIHGVRVVGVDLSGPANTQETAAVWGTAQGATFQYHGHRLGIDDSELLGIVEEQLRMGPTVVGIDAPLSYEPGGGLRQRDRDLQQRLTAAGMHPGSVMAPTMTRMCYLTLRGVALTRLLARGEGEHPVQMVEVHPGGALVLHGAPADQVRRIKEDLTARSQMREFLGGQNLLRLPTDVFLNDHVTMAAACALAAWRWSDRKSAWIAAAEPPLHPHDFAC